MNLDGSASSPNNTDGSSEQVDPVFEMFYSALKDLVRGKPGEPSIPIQEALKKFMPEYRTALFARWTSEANIVLRPKPEVMPGRSRPAWRKGYSTANGKHWQDLRGFLLSEKGRTADQLQSLDIASDEVLLSTGDPVAAQELDLVERRVGLVMGYVQSGKTANYTAVAAKAFDAGYRLVIVLTGIHNSLRRQTQIRMNDELGVFTTDNRKSASSMAPDDPSRIQSLTSEDLATGDFKFMSLTSNILSNGKFLCVTKKNASVLRNLINWLGKNVSVPVLIIDDEADQASVNTGGNDGGVEDPDADDRDPAIINGLIRRLAWQFKGTLAFVGYTATPYANVFVDRRGVDTRFEADLYPKDFIIALPKPDGYMGPEEFFGPRLSGGDPSDTDYSEHVINIVPDEDSLILEKLGRKPDTVDPETLLPGSLVQAVRDFVLATAARRTVEEKKGPSAFLAHTSHLQPRQELLAEQLEKLVMRLHQDWRYDRESALPGWEDDWQRFTISMVGPRFAVSFDQLVPELEELLGKYGQISIRVLNFKSQDELDYEVEPDLTAIVVGGNKLSRGLTIEGLLVSYFLRASKQPKADTLTQMGRFFGYRKAIVDITRVYTTDQLRNEFRDISQLEAALRSEISRYIKYGKSPEDFAPRVQRKMHLMPTAKNKMKKAAAFGISYSGDLVQTTSFPNVTQKVRVPSGPQNKDLQALSQVNVHEFNYSVTKKFLAEVLSIHGSPEKPKGDSEEKRRFLWRNVSPEMVQGFLTRFQTVAGATRFDTSKLASYLDDVRESTKSSGDQELSKWSVAVIGRAPDAALGIEDFGVGLTLGRITRSLDKGSVSSIGTLVNPVTRDLNDGDELIDLSKDQIDEARAELKDHPEAKVSDVIRSMRPASQGLIAIYPISPHSKPKNVQDSVTLGTALFGAETEQTIVGITLVFPHSVAEIEQYWSQESDSDDIK